MTGRTEPLFLTQVALKPDRFRREMRRHRRTQANHQHSYIGLET